MSLLVMVVGNIVWNNISQDLSQYGGLWSRRPVSGICYLVGAASLVALPPFGGFWSLARMGDRLAEVSGLLLLVLLLVNALTAFSVTREFCVFFGGKIKPMTLRSPEALWPLVIPMTVTMGFALHLPILLAQWHLLPSNLNLGVAFLLVLSTAGGVIPAAYIYLNENISKPIVFQPKALQDFFANDLYTAKLYKVTIVFVVGLISQIINWIDTFLVDGIVNLVGLATVFGGQSLKYNVSGQTQFYFLSIILGVALIGIIICWPLLSQISLVFS
jgi:NAD(P)H-quinone oxidoreductase subunit 5